ncbi:MAG: glucosyltransferase domain-containing protein, partial [Endomicrobium sp.]|nr:glucosyltransferase domain-containing protein [Endomicrobium sp.]
MIDIMKNSIDTVNLIPKYIKKACLIIFFGTVLSHSLFLINYMPLFEDWPYIFEKMPFFSWDVNQGRYFSSIAYFLFGRMYSIPLLGYLVTFFMLSLTSVLLCSYWKVPKTTITYSFVGLALTLQPYLLGAFSCLGYIENFFRLPFFAMVGFLLCEKVKANNVKYSYKIFLLIGSALSFFYTFGAYPLIANTIAVVFLGRLLIDFVLSKDKKISYLIFEHKYTMSVILIAFILHCIIVFYLWHKGVVVFGDYNVGVISISEMSLRFWGTIKFILTYLYNYSVPFHPQAITLMWLFLLLLVCSVNVWNFMQEDFKVSRRILNCVLMGFLFFTISMASFATNFVSIGSSAGRLEADFFGVAFFHVLILAILFNKEEKIVKNAVFLVCICLLWTCIIQDFICQKVCIFGFEAEKQQVFKIINRIETTAGFEKDKSYKIFILGACTPLKKSIYSHLYKNDSYNGDGGRLFKWSIMAGFHAFNIAPINIYTGYGYKWQQIQPAHDIETFGLIRNEVFKAKPWPDLMAVQIKNDIILVVL